MQSENLKQLIFSQSAMYLLLGTIVFVVPVIAGTGSEVITKNTTALLFIVGACFGLMQSISMLTSANAAADRIEALEMRLRDAVATPPVSFEAARRFDKIELLEVTFHYPDRDLEPGFRIGPLDFTLEPGIWYLSPVETGQESRPL